MVLVQYDIKLSYKCVVVWFKPLRHDFKKVAMYRKFLSLL